MTSPAVLSLFTGYGGLDLAVTALTGGTLVGVSDIEKGPCELLAARHPDVPNFGDVKAIDWNDDAVPHFDVLCGGYPCQPFSAAGRRAGTDDPRHLWPFVLKAIMARRPRQVFLENVRGHLTLGFDTVVRDLTAAGYDVQWSICAAASVGAPHRRERLYIYATPDELGHPSRCIESLDAGLAALPRTKKGNHRIPAAGQVLRGRIIEAKRVDAGADPSSVLLPTPVARDGRGRTSMNRDGGPGLADIGRLLPTQTTSDGEKARSNPAQARRTSPPLSALPLLLPTPRANDMTGSRTEPRPDGKSLALNDVAVLLPTPIMQPVGWSPFNTGAWGTYAVAVARWSLILDREAPAPVAPNRNGRPALTAEFAEWMMGLPAGWITGDDLGLSRSNCLKLAGNGVVPQAAHFAYSALLSN